MKINDTCVDTQNALSVSVFVSARGVVFMEFFLALNPRKLKYFSKNERWFNIQPQSHPPSPTSSLLYFWFLRTISISKIEENTIEHQAMVNTEISCYEWFQWKISKEIIVGWRFMFVIKSIIFSFLGWILFFMWRGDLFKVRKYFSQKNHIMIASK